MIKEHADNRLRVCDLLAMASDAYQTVLKLDKGSSEIHETRRFTKGEGNKKKNQSLREQWAADICPCRKSSGRVNVADK
jgi:hypothetical protein